MNKTSIARQYREIKSKHPHAILLFRCGDFYESYNVDAKECTQILGITLTWRNNNEQHNYETYEGAMAGFPHHALDTYLPKLIRAGKSVAICDQLEDPKLTKKLVKRIVAQLNNTNVCSGCRYNKGAGCNRLVAPGGMGRHDRVAKDYLHDNKCDYRVEGEAPIEAKPNLNFENS